MKKAFFLIAALALAIAAFSFLRLRGGRSETVGSRQPLEGAVTAPANELHSSLGTAVETADSEITAHDRAQAETLESVLAAHNDNDMRLDTDLKALDAGAKTLFRRKYDQLAQEKRNAKGTVVFLLGRNIASESDLAFMSKVLSEPPCRSMQNCANDPPHSTDADGDLAVNVSLAYPQIVALKSLERVLESGKTNPLYEQSLDVVHQATQSPVGKVANLARAMEAKYGR